MSVAVTPGAGATVAADVVGGAAAPSAGQQIQYVKLDVGAAGATAPVTTANPLPITVADGGIVAIGTTTDAAQTAVPATGSLISWIKGLFAFFQNVFAVDGATGASGSLKVGGIYLSTPLTLTNGQQSGLLLDSRQNAMVNLATKLDSTNDQVGVQPQDVAATTGNITVVDSGTTTTSNSLGQSIITGTPTAGSFVTATLNGQTCVTVQISGTNSNVLVFDRSVDGGTTFLPVSMEELSLGPTLSTLTISDNKAYFLRASAGGLTQFRVRCTTHTSGTAAIVIQPGFGVANVPVGQFAGPWTVSPQAVATGGATTYHLPSAAGTTNATNVKNAAGTLYGIEAFNTAAYTVFLKIYDKATAPTVGTDTPVKTIAIPATVGGVLGGVVRSYPVGIALTNGLSFALTKLVADNDTTVIVAADVSPLDLDYK